VAKKTTGITIWLIGVIVLALAGYLVTGWLISGGSRSNPSVLTGLFVALTIPFAMRTPGMVRAALLGLALGLAGSLGATGAIFAASQEEAGVFTIERLTALAGLTVLVTCIFTTAAGALFGSLAARRAKRTKPSR
jgi:hypothetical protein